MLKAQGRWYLPQRTWRLLGPLWSSWSVSPDILAANISSELKIPTIGIGAGKDCDGQVLVYHDLVGLFERFTPKFVKQYINLSPKIREALKQFKKDVESGAFPGPEHSFAMNPEEAEKIYLEEGN